MCDYKRLSINVYMFAHFCQLINQIIIKES